MLTQLGKYYAQSWAYHFTFASVNEKMGPKETLPLVFGTFFMNTIAPSLNMAGATLVVDDARRRGIPGGKATSAALLMQMTIESGFMTIMVVGFIILQVTGNLSPAWFLTGLVVVVMVGFMGGIMFIGRKSPKMLVGLLHPVERLVNRILKKFNKNPLDPWAEKAVASFGDAAGTIAANPKTAAKALRLLHCRKHVRTCGVLPGGRCVQYHESRSADMRLRYCYAACHDFPRASGRRVRGGGRHGAVQRVRH